MDQIEDPDPGESELWIKEWINNLGITPAAAANSLAVKTKTVGKRNYNMMSKKMNDCLILTIKRTQS